MIKRLCPNGVEFKRLGEVCLKTNKVKWSETCSDFKYIDLTSVDRKTHSIKDCDIINKDNAPSRAQQVVHTDDVIFGTTRPTLMRICNITEKHDGQICSTGFCVIRPNKMVVLPHFLYHILLTDIYARYVQNHQKGANYPSISDKEVFRFEIPLPPMEVQEEIVRILDKFTELEAELEAELDCRKRQYEYYRDQLLSFDNLRGGQGVTWLPITEVFEMRNGYTPSKSNSAYWEGGTIPWFRMEDIRQNGRILSDSIQHITMEGVKKGNLFKANSFILATTATIGEHALIIADSLANQQFTNLSIRKSLKDKVMLKFMFHYMFIIDEWCKNNTNISGFASVDMKKFKQLEIPIPSIEEQNRIVAILDRFEALTTSLQEGLPAEIVARRQQYEYYRDTLLDFKRKTA